ncbi:MAG: phosphoribosyltransferase [Bacteroidales bacterium]|jgi:uncharacterized protein|nr:phosphoribosyltransferase [Bacteroidales bacterium]
MSEKSMDEVMERFRSMDFPETFDTIVAIANGGIVPAAILNQRLDIGVQLLRINLRDPFQKPRHEAPLLLEPIQFDVKGKRILLVEDRVKTGATLNYAVKLLTEAGAAVVKTFAVNGKADYALYNETCFKFPWILT